MGGMIAQELTLRHPAQVQKLVLGCTTPGGPLAMMKSLKKLVAALSLQTVDQDAAGGRDSAVISAGPLQGGR